MKKIKKFLLILLMLDQLFQMKIRCTFAPKTRIVGPQQTKESKYSRNFLQNTIGNRSKRNLANKCWINGTHRRINNQNIAITELNEWANDGRWPFMRNAPYIYITGRDKPFYFITRNNTHSL